MALLRHRALHACLREAWSFAEAFPIGAANDDDRESQRALLPYLKLKLAEYRRALLRMPPVHPGLLIEPLLRQRTGDTQKLRRPTLFKPD